jgi:anti-sigma regulatory factor (Ser/Thr protein kinase)
MSSLVGATHRTFGLKSRFNCLFVSAQRPTLLHQVAFYDDADGFLAAAVPYLRQGLEAGEPILVALGPAKTDLLRGALGIDAEPIAFADVEVFGRNPARLLPAWQDFVDRHPPERPLRGLGEPIWPGRSAAAVDECERHEALFNVGLAAEPRPALTALCLYDRASLDDDTIEEAVLSHPLIHEDGASRPNAGWDDHQPEPFAGSLPAPPLDARQIEFDRETLNGLRAAAGIEAGEAGLPEGRAADFVLAASEIAANSVVHGGGSGTATIWREPGALLVEVEDAGRIENPLAGRVRPLPHRERGRGLWVANQLGDLLQIRSGPHGTRARLWMDLP